MTENMESIPLRKMGFYEKNVKRILDIVCAVSAVICLSPLYFGIALLVKLKLGSPILFTQERPGMIGEDGKETIFKIYKFRSMENRRDEHGELLPDEARLTKFGIWLRKTSLDELGEIFNILNGTMSVIGPRPQLVKDLAFMTKEQRVRHTAKPGLSGLAQIKGRNAISWEDKLKWDQEYIKNVGFISDVKIIFYTIKTAFIKQEGITQGDMATAEDLGDYLLRTGKITQDEYNQKLKKAREICNRSTKKNNNGWCETVKVKEQVKNNPKVSIIVPMYNAVNTLKETIASVQAQTYSDWELILVDDCSKDGTKRLAESLAEKDKRIKVFQMPKNGGPGAATKMGFKKSSGSLIAFIDADDLWTEDKLERQIKFMINHNYEFICSDYCWIDENGADLHKIIKCKTAADYKTILKSCPIGSSTVVITAEQLRKIDIPVIRKNNDYALWLQVLRDGTKIYGMHEIFMKYRIISTSNSFQKWKMIKYFWKVYREYEKFSVIKSLRLIGWYSLIKLIGMK
ncbi:MAG: glycosyltransferase [Lachnospiraceae bacterium]|nr:glycosyltransferase [Lachnospiraceae bacterium]